MLTHANLIADAAGTTLLLDEWEPGDRHIRYGAALLLPAGSATHKNTGQQNAKSKQTKPHKLPHLLAYLSVCPSHVESQVGVADTF